jgi:hypothetical protein
VVSDQATDTLIGGLGNDHYLVDDALDVVVESVGAGNDVLESSSTIRSTRRSTPTSRTWCWCGIRLFIRGSVKAMPAPT